LATKAITTNIAIRLKIRMFWVIASGELTLTFPTPPTWMLSDVMPPKASRKNSTNETRKTGLLSW